MLAKVQVENNGYHVVMERQLNHTCEQVWDMLTQNEQLEKWFEELRVGMLAVGGYMKFLIKDVNDQNLLITECIPLSVLAFDWFGDEVRFELHTIPGGCNLVFIEQIGKLTEQTKKDIAGWHVCLDVIASILDGKEFARESEWEKRYVEYSRVIDELTIG